MPKGYHHLTYEERCQIEALKQRGDCGAAISRQVGVHRSTICREICRHSGKKGYHYQQAHRKARQKRRHRRPVKMTEAMISQIRERLQLQWSPEQISGWMKLHGCSSVSPKTIYRYIWKDKQEGGVLFKQLRHQGKRYNRRGKGQAGRGCIPKRVGIEERPAIVNAKERIGDWELDSIVSNKGGKGAIVSIVDRASKMTRLAKVHHKQAALVAQSIINKLTALPVLTLTSDNGKEFACHEQVAVALNAQFFFATPYHSWERGLNEHTNGLIRQYFPKGISLEDVSQEDLDRVEVLLNNRPRKVLNYRSPIEAFQQFGASASGCCA